MRKAILIVAALPAAVAWAQVAAQRATPGLASLPTGQAGPVLGRPLTATEIYRSTQVLPDGTRVDHNNTSLFYRDDQGRMRTESQETALIFDPVAGFNYVLQLASKTYTQSAIVNSNAWTWVSAAGNGASVMSSGSRQAPGDPAAKMAQRRFGAPAAQPVTETLPPRNVNGILANGSLVTITIPKGALGNDRDMKVVNERWYSDDLKVLVKSTNTDPRYGVTTYDLTQVVQGSPNPILFQVPADYKLRGAR